MARSRILHPGFFHNEDLLELSPLTRLLFEGLWTIADREGRLEDRPKRIKLAILPVDDHDIDQALSDLARSGFLLRYEVDGRKYIQISEFAKYQKPHYRESASVIPAPNTSIGERRPIIAQSSANDAPTSANVGASCLPVSVSVSVSDSVSEATPTSAVAPTTTPPAGPGPKSVGRFFLHRWQVEELITALGPHADDFDLDIWLDELTRKANAERITFPTRDGRWTWIQAQLAAEIKRRNLPTADVPPKALAEVRSTVPGVAATARYLD